MSGTRYAQFCALARAAEIIGERWTLLIIRELLLAPMRFGDLEARLNDISPALLTGRLNALIENGVVRPAPDLRAILERVGFGPGDHIVTHCEGGGRAALGAAAAVRAGFDDVRVYYLSFGDWVRDESCPIVRD